MTDVSDTKPVALVTNDDGVHCYFLRALVEALIEEGFDVKVSAPLREQSWIGRGVSRFRDVQVEPFDAMPCPAWAVDGTPTDCVNLALSHLCPDPQPDIVISGINVGFNSALPLILASGTVAGALEGACWGLRAMAVSQMIPKGYIEDIRRNITECPPEFVPELKRAAGHAARQARAHLEEPARPYCVHNWNYPYPLPETPTIYRTVPAGLHLGGLFEEAEEGRYRFKFNFGEPHPNDFRTDRETIRHGGISHSILDYARLGVSTGAEPAG